MSSETVQSPPVEVGIKRSRKRKRVERKPPTVRRRSKKPHSQLSELRKLRAEFQDLGLAFETVRKGEATVQSYASYIERTSVDIDKLLKRIKDSNDTLRHIRNTWEQMRGNPLISRPGEDHEAQEQLHHLKGLAGHIHRIEQLTGHITIPSRLRKWLKNARPGYYIPFHLVFEDELPDAADRKKMLDLLAYSPKVINGLVDSNSGLIFRYSPERKGRIYSCVGLALAFVVTVLVVGASSYVPLEGWPIEPAYVSKMLLGWLFVLVGLLVHVAVATAKRRKAGGGFPPVIAVRDLGRTVDAKLGQMLTKLLLALIGFFGLVFAVGPDQSGFLNAFLVGYSLDSVIELFGTSLEQRADALKDTLKKQLSLTNGT